MNLLVSICTALEFPTRGKEKADGSGLEIEAFKLAILLVGCMVGEEYSESLLRGLDAKLEP